MKIVLEKNTNGIHDYLTIIVDNPKTEDLELLKDILLLVDSYNKNQIEKA